MAGWNVNGVEFERPAGQRGAVFVYDGQMWDTAEHGLFCTALTVGSPEVRQNKREALARDGFIDLTEQFGRPVFGNRTISWRFLVTEEDWQTRCAEVREFIADLHGRKVDILVDDYEGWTFTGRLALERVTHQLDGTYVEVTADCEPFRRDGSTFSLDAEAVSFTLGPAEVIEPSRDIASYLANPDSYSLVLGTEAVNDLLEYTVYAAGKNVALRSSSWGGTWESMTLPRTPGTPLTKQLFSANNLVIPVLPDGTDLYCMFSTNDIYDNSHVTECLLSKYPEMTQPVDLTRPGSVKLVQTFTAGANDPELEFMTYYISVTMDSVPSAGAQVRFVAVPHGSEPPTYGGFSNVTGNHIAQRVADVQSAESLTEPLTVDGKAAITVEDISSVVERPILFAIGKRRNEEYKRIPVTFAVSGNVVHDLSEFGYRFYELTGTIPADASNDPPYIEIDGRRYYADDTAYTIKVNAGYRSSVSVHGSGPALTAEGLAI